MEKDDILSWSNDYFLDWSDFKAASNPSTFEDSFSKIKFHYTWTINSDQSNGKICFLIDNIELSSQFLRHLSWVRENQTSLDLLKHEQGHFDLAELLKPMFTEKLQNKLQNKKFSTRGKNPEQQKQFAREDSGLMIGQELEKCYLEFSQKRKKYDDETEFGHNREKQKEYDEQFDKLRK